MHPPTDRAARTPISRLFPLAFAFLALAALSACVQNTGQGGPFPGFAEYDGREIRKVDFAGDLKLREDTIRSVVNTRKTRCKLLLIPICPFGVGRTRHELDLNVLARDVQRIQLLYRDEGYYGTRVVPHVDPIGDDKVSVQFTIAPGDRVILRDLAVTGTTGIVPPEEMERRLPLEEGEPFGRSDFIASEDTIRNALLQRGYAYAQVLRNYSLDTIADAAAASFEAVPGPVVTVDTVLFIGMDRIEEKIARRQISLREGSLLRASELARSQRNLFELELVSFASVEIAPDSLQLTPDSLELASDSLRTTVLVRIVEAPRYAVETSVGYGTFDCFRGLARHTDRNFLGGTRRLELVGSVAKVGAATGACPGLKPEKGATALDTVIAEAVNYRLAADFLQPRLFGTQTSVIARGHFERVSELGLYLRDSYGGQIGAVREIAARTVATGTFNVQRGRTQASEYFFCLALVVCVQQDIEELRRTRWSNSLSAAVVRNRTRGIPYPRNGYQARSSVDWASALLGSDDRYLRTQVDGVAYRQVSEDWVLSGRLMGGAVVSGGVGESGGYIPPERRFYGGGPNNVRGFRLNTLGPLVYVDPPGEDEDEDPTPAPMGGTRTVLGSVELEMPLPYRPDLFRWAAFVDAGQVWAGEREVVADSGSIVLPGDTVRVGGGAGIRVTPGAGLRVATPVGPIRFDVAFNPYDPEPGPRYRVDETTRELRLVDPDYQGASGGFWDRITFQIAVGRSF